jgi:raffinose/stachyose/melibiose transport system substrate-binding protein
VRRKSIGILLACMLALAAILAGCGGNSNNGGNNGGATGTNSSSGGSSGKQEKVKMSLLVDNSQDSINIGEALVKKFTAKYPHIEIELETRPGGGEGDNFVKTRLATGDMNDIFFYNSGSLLQALNPEQNLLDLTGEPFADNLLDSFKPVVSSNGKLFGVPFRSSVAGGWFYNKKLYEEHGLSVPKTWDELMANLDKLKGSGAAPLIGSYKDTWTSQLIMLADFYNVLAEEPNFPDDYTANMAKYANTPAALRSFQKLAQTVGYYNEDLMATTYDAALGMLAEGKGAHYPMLSFAVPVFVQNYPDLVDDIGFFAQPGDDPDNVGLTVWMPDAAYIYKNTKHPEEAKMFLSFLASVEGTEVLSEVTTPSGPYVIKGAKLPEEVPQVVKDMLPYFNTEGKTAPALEFLSPVKGPMLEQLTVEVGAGMRSAEDAAALYDEDVAKQARQLGLEGW